MANPERLDVYANRNVEARPSIQVVPPPKKQTAPLKRIELATVLSCLGVIVACAVWALFTIGQIVAVSYETNKRVSEQTELQNEVDDLRVERNQLSSYDRILKIAKKNGLSLDANRVQSLK
ncbi:MAG: cell division protein FtsL [Bacilli bacterium]